MNVLMFLNQGKTQADEQSITRSRSGKGYDDAPVPEASVVGAGCAEGEEVLCRLRNGLAEDLDLKVTVRRVERDGLQVEELMSAPSRVVGEAQRAHHDGR